MTWSGRPLSISSLKVASQVMSRMMMDDPDLEKYEPLRQVIIEAKNAAKRERQQ